MLKYEERLHLDKHYEKLRSSHIIKKAISLTYGIIGYVLLYSLLKYILAYIPDYKPWNNFEVWVTIANLQFLKSDLIYFIGGLIFTCYGSIKLARITLQNHSVKNKETNRPTKLLITGDYAKVRHPMYGTFIILQSGFLLSLRSSIGMILVLLIIVFQYMNAQFEEKRELIPVFKDEYHHYKNKVHHVLFTKIELVGLLVVLGLFIVGYAF